MSGSGRPAARGAAGVRSTVSHSSCSRANRSCGSFRLANAALVSATTGSQLAMMPALESRAFFRRGSIMGTAMTPAIRQPMKATRNSRPGGNTSRARSSGWVLARLASSAFEFLLELHLDIDDHRGIQAKAAEFRVGLDPIFCDPEHARPRSNAKVRDLLSCRVRFQCEDLRKNTGAALPVNFRERELC
ncbi:MAG: hypothetical protein ABI561_05775 [Bradyrhizobium sp.]